MAEPLWIRQAADLGRSLGFSVKAHEPMSRHTSFKVGGPADVLADPSEPEHVRALRSFALRVDAAFTVIGAGTNIIVRDGGIRGVVCRIGPAMSRVTVNRRDLELTVQGGALVRRVCLEAADASLSGIEWAIGIPGTVGGAVCMNAGAHGGCMADVVIEALTIGPDAGLRTWAHDEIGFGYRTTALQGTGHVVLEVKLTLAMGHEASIRARHEEILALRRDSQPLDLPSAGSVFKRPHGDYAGRLIEAAGLKGTARVGGAMVSDKHAGFIVNTGNATAADVIALVEHVRDRVREHSGVTLETEVLVLGEDWLPPLPMGEGWGEGRRKGPP